MNYFGYGSNMNLDHMRRLCGWHFRVLGAARLKDFELGADLRGFATIHDRKDSVVLGVLYEIDQECLDILDEFEGYPDVFSRREVNVEDMAGKKYVTWVYIEPADQFLPKGIREEYIRRAVAGAVENHLPEQWVKFLESLAKK
jgi:gamma-glutamylcyclotransferase (GGCT)/AIG2-like uncharacterized protein YtfP